MGAPSVGDVVIIPFPYSDLSQSKRRPALVLAEAGRGDFLLCQITSKQYGDLEALFQELGGDVSERAASRVAVVLFGEVRVFHRPHPSPDTDKGAVASICKWFEEHGVTP
jgi:hypothetical protein